MGPHEGVPPKTLSGAAGGNAPFRSLIQFQAERHGARRAVALLGPVVGSPDGERQSGFGCWRNPRRPPPVLPLAKGELEGDRDGMAIALRQFRPGRSASLRISGIRRSLPRLATRRNRTRPRHPPGTRWGVRQGGPGAAIPANPVSPSTLSSRKIRQDLSGTQTLGAGGQMGPGYLLTQIPG